ncbi:ribosomal protein L16/L10AE [Nonomuraea thailandensis]|uniref:Ribosomal protein L16/L10AE n=1 Tax=Nonomuraea thailandensis TaxID=1188745 RepID=A0A9X2K5L8_9ACTN|nr:ribosomal protein L16/L10AE [Nonomuraea thailandensis]
MDPQRSEDIRHRGVSSRSEAIRYGMDPQRSEDIRHRGVSSRSEAIRRVMSSAEGVRVNGFSMDPRRSQDNGVLAELGKGARQ